MPNSWLYPCDFPSRAAVLTPLFSPLGVVLSIALQYVSGRVQKLVFGWADGDEQNSESPSLFPHAHRSSLHRSSSHLVIGSLPMTWRILTHMLVAASSVSVGCSLGLDKAMLIKYSIHCIHSWNAPCEAWGGHLMPHTNGCSR